MFGRIYAIGINTFREAVRDRVLYGVVGCATAVLLFSLALAQLSLNEQERVVMDIGLASISLFAVVVAVFLGSSLLYKEIERKTLYVILPKPIHRAEFLLGKYAGIVLTALVFILLMGAVQLWVASVQAGADLWALLAVPVVMGVALAIGMRVSRDRTAVLVPMSLAAALAAGAVAASAGVEVGVVAASLLLNAAEVAVVSAVALLFSSFSTPFLTGLLSLGVWIVGRSADDMASMRSDAIGPEVKSLLSFLSEIVPNFNLFVPGRQSLLDESHGGPVIYVAQTLGYAALYTAVVLFLATPDLSGDETSCDERERRTEREPWPLASVGRRVLAIVGVVLAVLTVRVVTSARAELAEASRLERAGEIDFAIVHYRRAASWYAPGNPYVADALGALARIGETAEAEGDAPRALAAWRSIRGAILSSRSVYTPHKAALSHANERIATVMASLDPPPMDAGKSPEELRAEHLALLRATHRPSVPWTLVLLAGFLAWVGGAWLFAMKGIDDEGRVRPRSARLWGSTVIIGLGLFVLGLALA